MDRRNIAAHTTPGCNYPSFISINELGEPALLVSVTVRGPAKKDGSCGDTATIVMMANEFVELIEQVNNNFQIRSGDLVEFLRKPAP
jgi:hypothetical protein